MTFRAKRKLTQSLMNNLLNTICNAIGSQLCKKLQINYHLKNKNSKFIRLLNPYCGQLALNRKWSLLVSKEANKEKKKEKKKNKEKTKN